MITYQITDGSAATNRESWLAGLRRDVSFIQIRERDLSARELIVLVRLVMETVPGPRILVNDRSDVAVAAGAAGVHLRSGSASPANIRRLGRLIVTVACHDMTEVRNAHGADYLLISPVFRPLSKIVLREPLGLAGLNAITSQSPVPVIALGGITRANISGCMKAGAAGVAGITLFQTQGGFSNRVLT